MDSMDEDNLLESPELDQNVEQIVDDIPQTGDVRTSKYVWLTVSGCLNSLVQMLIGANVFVGLWFAFKSTPIGAFELHVGLTVIGYQLLMSHAILSLNENNAWSSQLSVLHRMRAHVILQILGSALAIAGSVIMMMEKTVNFTSVHGKLALAALIFTGVSLINGTISLFSRGRNNIIKCVKINHVICGTAAFAISSASLSYGYYKKSFEKWASQDLALVMTCITAFYTLVIVIRPWKTFLRKLLHFMKIKIF